MLSPLLRGIKGDFIGCPPLLKRGWADKSAQGDFYTFPVISTPQNCGREIHIDLYWISRRFTPRNDTFPCHFDHFLSPLWRRKIPIYRKGIKGFKSTSPTPPYKGGLYSFTFPPSFRTRSIAGEKSIFFLSPFIGRGCPSLQRMALRSHLPVISIPQDYMVTELVIKQTKQNHLIL